MNIYRLLNINFFTLFSTAHPKENRHLRLCVNRCVRFFVEVQLEQLFKIPFEIILIFISDVPIAFLSVERH